MTEDQRNQYLAIYRDGLLNDVLPFWTAHGIDYEHGGFLTALNQDGSVLDTDKGIWQQGRFTWLLATLYNTVEPRAEWLDLARHGVDFIRKHGFDEDGRMFFHVAQDGTPLRKRRYVFSEAFAAIALAAYARAAQDDEMADEANRIYQNFLHYSQTPGALPPKGVPGSRPAKGIGQPMITINVAQVMRETIDAPGCTEVIGQCIEEIQRDFMKPDLQVVMEQVAPDGSIIDHFDGRTLNPGHAIEAAWFILHEARLQGNDAALIETGTQILDWMWARGWDTEYGGILYFRDLNGLPVQEYWHDMKFWWPHNETIIATLLAHVLTGEAKYEEWHRMVHDWAYRHFPDPEHGEWFGYLHRDGRLSVPLKGNIWKGPFHLPRQQWYCWQLLETQT